MIDRSTFDLRIAEHRRATARANARDWQRQAHIEQPIDRVRVFAAIAALGKRLNRAHSAARHTPAGDIAAAGDPR